MKVLNDLLYTKSHEWVKVENGIATVGVTDYAQHSLGSVVYVEGFVGDEVEQFSRAPFARAAFLRKQAANLLRVGKRYQLFGKGFFEFVQHQRRDFLQRIAVERGKRHDFIYPRQKFRPQKALERLERLFF